MGLVADSCEQSFCMPEMLKKALPSPPLSPVDDNRRRVVLICKKTRWMYEGERLGGFGRIAADDKLSKSLRSRGVDPTPIKEKHDIQKDTEARIVQQLICNEVAVCTFHCLPPSLPPCSLVVAAGGDGTFLSAASLIYDHTPLVGINTDPQGSEGHLCVGGKNAPKDVVERILSSDTQWDRRSRIKVTVLHSKIHDSQPLLALNEVFIGEKDSAKVSYYDISIDGGPSQRQKSSGIVACTGSGSSAWYTSINRVHPSTVSSVLDSLRSVGISIPSDVSLISRVTDEVNNSLAEPHDSPYVHFSVREPIFNKTFAPSPTKGKATKLTLRSRCSNACLVLDGSRDVPFDYGTIVELEIDERYSLNTLL